MVAATRPFFPLMSASHREQVLENEIAQLQALNLRLAARSDNSLERLREVWAALGCAPNPDDFKPTVQEQMWSLALVMMREATARASSVYRENSALREALNSSLTAEHEPRDIKNV